MTCIFETVSFCCRKLLPGLKPLYKKFIVGVLGKQVQRRYFTADHRIGEVIDPRVGTVEGGILAHEDSN